MRLDRRNFLKAAGCAAAGIVSNGCWRQASHSATKKPNFIIIMADDLGYGDLSCYGSTLAKTPNIDALAAGGLKFTDYHSNGAVCSPTRAALVTGRYQQRSGITGVVTAKSHRHTGMDLAETTFAEVLRCSGYATGLFGKWHLGYSKDYNPIHQGFDEFTGFVSGNVDYHSHIDQEGYEDWWQGTDLKPEEGYSTYLIAQHGLAFLEKHNTGPFCLYLAHESPHYPLQGPDDPPARTEGKGRSADKKPKKPQAVYRTMIEALDKTVGDLVTKVKQLGLEENTFIFFCSDNGANRTGSNAPLRGYKCQLWEGGHRVPAIAYWPGKIAAGTVTDETALGMDLFATMSDLAGAPLPAGLKLDGVSLAPLMLKNQKLPKRSLFWQCQNQKAIRKGDWKLVVNPEGKEANDGYLFNLKDDLSEKNNLTEQYPDIVKELTEALEKWEREVSAGVQNRS
jgi:arylsulfatase A-like enzyme